ncbi:AAA family ATPase [Aeromonas veronii]|uniref:AAA family ATPase n=1 Tax=Aeromonas veronii TaxID=654 RepID=UPI0038D568F8
MLEIKHKLVALLAQLNEGLVDRDEAMKLALLSLLAGENILLVGPPGTAKSLISRQVAKALKDDDKEGASHFEYLLTKFSTPEEIFGPLSISKLKEDRFERNTAGYLPSVQVAFLDEIFKASSSILNALLTILNERIYHNGASVQRVPLRSLIAASNELPTGQEELGALYDRFLLRSFVNYVSEDNLHKLFTLGEGRRMDLFNQLTLVELAELDKKIASVKISELIQSVVLNIWRKYHEIFKDDRREGLSDRRLVKTIHLLQVSALTNDRDEVNLSDLILLRHCLWAHPDNIGKVKELVFNTLRSVSYPVPKNGNDSSSLMISNLLNSCDDTCNKHRSSISSGLYGNGTEEDPIEISCIEHFFLLSNPDVSQKEYFFKQVSNIDLSVLSSWTPIDFKGFYDGGGFSIKGLDNKGPIFNSIQPGSVIKNLDVTGSSLANMASNSKVSYCNIDGIMFLDVLEHSEVSRCHINSSLSKNRLNNCKVSFCIISGNSSFVALPKLSKRVDDSKIFDCAFILDGCDFSSFSSVGYVANICNNSIISRCFIEGECKGSKYLDSVFFAEYSNVEINSNACGLIKSYNGNHNAMYGFVSGVKPSLKSFNNISIDILELWGRVDDANGKDGKKIPSLLFKQFVFEHTLGWDFNNVWQWDSQKNSPRLKFVGVEAVSNPIDDEISESDKIDLLIQQMNANLWV